MESIRISPEALGLFSVPQYWQKEREKGKTGTRERKRGKGKVGWEV